MKCLIVSADDFGFSKGINRGIIKGFKDGIVTSIHLMPAASEFEDALEEANHAGIREMGAHLCLTGAVPVTNLEKISTLVANNARFHEKYGGVVSGLFFRKINLREVRLELKSQLERIKNSGIKITSLSSHEHVHMLPDILSIFVDLAKEYKIPAMRYPREHKLSGSITINKLYRICVLACFEKKMGAVLSKSGIAYTDNFLGLLDSGNLDEETLMRLLGALGQGCTELVTHPGFLTPEVTRDSSLHINCEKELTALTSDRVKKLISDLNIKLVTFEEFCLCAR